MKQKHRLTALAAAAVLAASAAPAGLTAEADYGVGGNGTAIMEYLDRGIYAVGTGNGMFVSWRFNANDADDAEYQLFRDGQLIYTSKAGEATCFLDAGGSAASKYRVDTLSGGTVVSSEDCRFSSGTNYFEIPLNNPNPNVYSPNDCCVGDVNGDGQYEIFVKWDPNNSKDNSQSGYTDNVFIDCVTLEGKTLWRIDLGKNIRAGQHYTQMCVADFDCDGFAELITKTGDGTKDATGKVIGNGSADYRNSGGYILSGPEYLSLFDGQTGAVLDTIKYPIERGTVNKSTWGDDYGNRVDRMNSAIAYLDGVHPSAVYQRGYYTRMTLSAVDVVDKKLSLRWVFDTGYNSSTPGYGDGNHNVMVADVDNDGRQEICTGPTMIDDNGKLLWCTNQGHGDAMHLGDLDPDRPGQEVWICHEDGKYGVSLVDAKNGSIIFHKDGDKDTGRCCADNVWAGNKGAELWGARPANTVMDVKGNKIGGKNPWMNFLIYWDGDLEREIQSGTAICKFVSPDVVDQVIFSADGCASNNGTKDVPCLTADIFGDWREELVLRTENNRALRVYCTPESTKVRLTTLMHDMQYRMQCGCEQSSYNQPPHASYYLGSDAPLPARPAVKMNNTPPEPVNGKYIKDLKVKDYTNSVGWQLADELATGTVIFGDREYTYISMPDELKGAEYLRTACNSKNTDADLATFKTEEEIVLYVLADVRLEENNSVPAWLSGFERTDLTADSDNSVTFRAYKKTVPAGESVTLGTNGMTGNVVNYTVAVKPAQKAPLTGDVNLDGAVNAADAVELLAHLMTDRVLSEEEAAMADIDGNGVLTAADLSLLKRILIP